MATETEVKNKKTIEALLLTPQQSSFIRSYSDPQSPTFSNCYRSALAAGYSDKTARNLSHIKPYWFSESLGQISMGIEPEHLTTRLTDIIYSDSEPTIIKLRAIELMMKYHGMFNHHHNKKAVTINVDLTSS